MDYREFERSIARRAKMERLKQILLCGMVIAVVLIGMGFAVYELAKFLHGLELTYDSFWTHE